MAVNNEQFLDFHIATDVFKSSCSQLHLRIRRARVGTLCFQKDLKLTVSLHLVMCACQSHNQHLAAAWTCISDAHLAVATRLRCVFHMTVVTHSSSDLSPRGVANMICSSQHSPDGFPANLLSGTGGWWERVRRGWRSKRTLPGGLCPGWRRAELLHNKPSTVWMRWKQHISVIYGVQEDHYGRFNLSLMDVSKCLLSWSLMVPCNQWNTWPPLPPST